MSGVPTIILGATGYVAGELLRLIAGHPELELAAAVSESKADAAIADVFPHLAGVYREERFSAYSAVESIIKQEKRVAIFGALPHGESAPRLRTIIQLAGEAGCDLKLVDLAADFRLESAEEWQRVYGEPHGAPELLPRFTCSVPEHWSGATADFISHPGCFTTCITTACYGIQKLGVGDGTYSIAAVTGASGSGRTPRAGTHFPERLSNYYAYSALAHRHEAEIKMLVGRAGGDTPEVLFVPHSGPFSRGIHATIQVRLNEEMTTEQLLDGLRQVYNGANFVRVKDTPPHLKEVVGTNDVCLSAIVRGRNAVVFSVIDNLTKGAAGGGVQWMNRLLGIEETAGLRLTGIGWH